MKKVSKKFIIVSVILIVPIIVIIFFGLWLYFAPVPLSVKEKYKGEVQRCIYPVGTGYYTTKIGTDAFYRLYNGNGEVICNSGGFLGKKPEGPCAQKMCFPIYDK